VTRTVARLPVPEPRQLRQSVRPDPVHVLHPTSPSDHREQGHATFPVPAHVEQLGPCAPPAPASGGLHSEHLSAAATPMNAPTPADATATMMGPTIL